MKFSFIKKDVLMNYDADMCNSYSTGIFPTHVSMQFQSSGAYINDLSKYIIIMLHKCKLLQF